MPRNPYVAFNFRSSGYSHLVNNLQVDQVLIDRPKVAFFNHFCRFFLTYFFGLKGFDLKSGNSLSLNGSRIFLDLILNLNSERLQLSRTSVFWTSHGWHWASGQFCQCRTRSHNNIKASNYSNAGILALYFAVSINVTIFNLSVCSNSSV